jgi:hypothetical protein
VVSSCGNGPTVKGACLQTGTQGGHKHGKQIQTSTAQPREPCLQATAMKEGGCMAVGCRTNIG